MPNQIQQNFDIKDAIRRLNATTFNNAHSYPITIICSAVNTSDKQRTGEKQE